MDFSKAFTFVTEDKGWIGKIGLGTLFNLLAAFLLPIPLLIGYQVAIARNVMDGVERPLPAWDDLGKLFTDGLYLLLARIVYTLPFTLLVCIGTMVSILPAMAGDNQDIAAVLGGVTVVVWLFISCLLLLAMFALLFVTPAIDIQYIRHNNVAACFRFREVWAIAQANMGDILLMAVAIIGANLVVGAVASLLGATVCGLIVAIPLMWAAPVYIRAVTGHMVGQIGLKTAKPKSEYALE